jgi:ubiquinol-cytochrome c reductase cytochrome b subunit
VIRSIRNWIEDRTGLGGVIDAMLLEEIPGGAKWRYVWGSALTIVFSIQLVTGLLLMLAYSPGDTTAWGSVYFIQYQMDFGWLIRGLHHFGSQTMVVLLGLHMLQVVIAGAHLKPREVNWWLGLGLAGVVLALSLTGYLLPWDQKGYYATQVATNIAGGLPYVGSFIQKIVVGGPQYGNHTLTRFFGLHVAILPGILITLLIAHIWVFRRHGVTAPRNPKGVGWFWPDQAFRDMLVGLVIFGIMLGLVIYGWGQKVEPSAGPNGAVAERTFYDKVAHAGRDGRGANLDAPADPNTPYPARPEWYFLSLFQLLKYFEGPKMLIGTVVIPAAIGLILFILPWLGYGPLRPFGRVFAVLFVLALFGGAAYLTIQAWVEDQRPEDLERQPYKALKEYVDAGRYAPKIGADQQQKLMEAEELAKRAITLAGDGIPATGARDLLRNDPMTAGKKLFKSKCATCHVYGDEIKNEHPTASDLKGWGAADWIKGLLTNSDDPKYFGNSHLKNQEMSKWVASKQKAAATDPKVPEQLSAVAEWLGTHPRKEEDANEKGAIAEGRELAFGKTGMCAKCHPFNAGPGDELDAPDLAGYGDADWLRGMIMNPASGLKYADKNRMPAFRDLTSPSAPVTEDLFRHEKAALLKDAKEDKDKVKQIEESHKVFDLSDLERELIIRFVTGDGRVVFGGEAISGPPVKK